MKYIHRIWFCLGTILILGHIFLALVLTSQEYSDLMKHPLLGPTFPLGGAFLLSYPYLVVFPIVDVFLKKRSKAVLLISMVVALPLLAQVRQFD